MTLDQCLEEIDTLCLEKDQLEQRLRKELGQSFVMLECPLLELKTEGSSVSLNYIQVPHSFAKVLEKKSHFVSLGTKSKCRFETKEWEVLAKKIRYQKELLQKIGLVIFGKLKASVSVFL